jgi:hypothetical protein
LFPKTLQKQLLILLQNSKNMIEMFVLRGMKQGLNVKGEIIFDGDI